MNLTAAQSTAVRVDGCDQPGGRIFADQVNVTGPSPSKGGVGVRISGVEQSDVLLRCLQGGGCSTWVQVLGGPNRQAGAKTPGQVAVLTGATSTSGRQYAVQQGGRLVVRAVYHEVSGEEPQAIGLSDAGTLSIDATRFSYKTSPNSPLFSLSGFRGELTLASCLLLPVDTPAPARLEITGDGSRCSALVLGDLFWVNQTGVTADKVLRNQADPPARAALMLCNMNSGKNLPGGFATLADAGPADEPFILKMLAPLRECRVWVPSAASPPGKTDLRLHRLVLSSSNGGCCLDLQSRPGTEGS
jgi:hypothetical protein